MVLENPSRFPIKFGGGFLFGKIMADKDEEVKNAKQIPAVFYAKHMESGHATYENETILLDNPMLIKMAQSFVGKPVFAENHQKVDIENLQEQADGYVTDSFYNELDGWLWVKFIAVSDEAFDAIGKGWGVSNAYVPTEYSGAGTHHNTPYDRKITDGFFTHLAIVEHPRYEESKILTPEEFKAYQTAAKAKLDEITNSKPKEEPKMFKIFKTKKEELTSIDPESRIELENGKSISIQEMVNAVKKNEADEKSKEEDEKEKFNMDDEIEVDGEKMPLKELVSRYQSLTKKNSDDKDEDDKSKENESEDKADEDKSKENEGESDKDEDKKKDDEEEKTNSIDFFTELKNAHKSTTVAAVEGSMDKVARGQSRYGSAQ